MIIEDLAEKLKEYARKRRMYHSLRFSEIVAVQFGEVSVNLTGSLRAALRKQLFAELHEEAALFDEFLRQNSADEERANLEQLLVGVDDR